MEVQQIDALEVRTNGFDTFPEAMGDAPEGWNIDPMEADTPSDEVVVTTRRRLLRLSIAATDVGARFEREGIPHDAAAWMLAPRSAFDDRTPIEACQELQGFNRNVLLHGLGLGLDADPHQLDDLLSDDECSGAEDDPSPTGDDVIPFPMSLDPQLLTCWVDADRDGSRVFGFCALVTRRPAELVERVVGRFGADAAATASYHVGFDQTTALATAMISPAMADTLLLVAEHPGSPLGDGLDVVVEQRFHA